jgi:cysteinyl-tRNA synthetase
MHGQHLLVDGVKMAKSTGNTYEVSDLEHRGFEPLAFRYLCSTARYRTRTNFTLNSLRAAQRGLLRLRAKLHQTDGRVTKKAITEGEKLRAEFWTVAADDLNIPRALAVAWRVARSGLPGPIKRELLMDFDRLLGLDLLTPKAPAGPPREVEALVAERHKLRHTRAYVEADSVRDRIRGMGYEVHDRREDTTVLPVPAWERAAATVSSSSDVRSLLSEPDTLEFTIGIVARQGCDELLRCLDSARHWASPVRAEILVVDNGFQEGCGTLMDDIAGQDDRVRVFHADHFLGAAAGRNVILRQAQGRYVLLLDTSVELKGDVCTAVRSLLEDPKTGIAGRWGAVSEDLRTFDEAKSSGDVDAVEGYLMAFRRELLNDIGLLDEKYRFYRHLDLDFSLAARTQGYRAVIDTDLPVARHEHVDWSQTPPEERERLSKRNFYRFLRKWGARTDLLVAQTR